MAANKRYIYEIEVLNMVNGRVKELREYESSIPLKIGNVYFHPPGLEVGAYRIKKEIWKENLNF